MFSRNEPPQQQPKAEKATPSPTSGVKYSYIGPDVSIDGNLSCAADLQFDGTINGDLDCRNLAVGDNAAIAGTVRVTSLSLNGSISGLVEAESVHLGAKAKLDGDIVYSSLAIDEGAMFEGNLRRRTAAITDEKVTVLHRQQ